ncbi:MAG: YqgE/AlgH family protein [Gammaproteobacteria bacterium]|nr:YqgE/AlgH family protein [Gammaproteobacteria bacterium]
MMLLRLLLLMVFSSTSAFSQMPSKGMLLVATDEMRDPRFSETIILLLHHESEGVLGVAINRPTWVIPSTVFPDMRFMENYSENIFVGGPMARTNVLALIDDSEIELLEAEPLFDSVYLSTNPEFLQEIIEIADPDVNLRLYAGHASWEVTQLEREIAAGQWKIIPATADLVFSQNPLRLWDQLQLIKTNDSLITASLPTDETVFALLHAP